MKHQTYVNQSFLNDFTLESLSLKSLAGASELRDNIFKNIKKVKKLTLAASLDKDNYIGCYEVCGIQSMQYWVLVDNKNKDRVIGLSGIYIEDGELNSCSLGWFCVDKNYRGRGIGEALLEFSITQAKLQSMQFLSLYTDNSKMYHPAIALYKKYGFFEYEPLLKESENVLYFKLKLSI